MRHFVFAIALCLASAATVSAQEFKVDFGVSTSDRDAPIEVSANALSVDQTTGKAIFDGDVEITQGNMRLTAALVNVVYDEAGNKIEQLLASGGVNIESGKDSAEADTAEYDVESGVIRMAGNVALLQQGTRITAGKMDVNLNDNTAAFHGRVRTVLQPGNN
ncbi:MAG: LptA/OstA family protein [Cognatishimia activa]